MCDFTVRVCVRVIRVGTDLHQQSARSFWSVSHLPLENHKLVYLQF